MPQPSWRCNTHASKAQLYADKNIPPLAQLLEQLQTEMQTGVALKATVDSGLVGSMQAHMTNGVAANRAARRERASALPCCARLKRLSRRRFDLGVRQAKSQ